VYCKLLYFVQNKSGVLALDKLVVICRDFYRSCEVDAARNLHGAVSGKSLNKHIGGSDVERRERTYNHRYSEAVLHRLPCCRRSIWFTCRTFRPLVSSALYTEGGRGIAWRSVIFHYHTTIVKLSSIKPCKPHIVAADDDTVAITETSNGSSFAAKARSLSPLAWPPHTNLQRRSHRSVIQSSAVSLLCRSGSRSSPDDQLICMSAGCTPTNLQTCCVKGVLGEDCGNIECNKLTAKYTELYARYHISLSTDVCDFTRVTV